MGGEPATIIAVRRFPLIVDSHLHSSDERQLNDNV